ncbi:Magnesium transporter MgtE [compost metagenome]
MALAILMPIVAGMGGNAGSQTMTVTVRALATRGLDIHNAPRIIRREAGVGLLNGMIFGTLIGLLAGLWFQDPNIGGIIATAMLINMMAAALAGIMVPLLLERSGADPAVSSAVFVTAITDITGFFSFLGIATWWFNVT